MTQEIKRESVLVVGKADDSSGLVAHLAPNDVAELVRWVCERDSSPVLEINDANAFVDAAGVSERTVRLTSSTCCTQTTRRRTPSRGSGSTPQGQRPATSTRAGGGSFAPDKSSNHHFVRLGTSRLRSQLGADGGGTKDWVEGLLKPCCAMEAGDVVGDDVLEALDGVGASSHSERVPRRRALAALVKYIGPKQDWFAMICNTVRGWEQRAGNVTYSKSFPWSAFLPSCFMISMIKLGGQKERGGRGTFADPAPFEGPRTPCLQKYGHEDVSRHRGATCRLPSLVFTVRRMKSACRPKI